MSCMICSHCGGSGKSARKGKLEIKTCRRCHGTGKSPEPDMERELATFLKTKRGPVIATSIHNGSSTGSFEAYK